MLVGFWSKGKAYRSGAFISLSQGQGPVGFSAMLRVELTIIPIKPAPAAQVFTSEK